MDSSDVIIIGAGMIGANCALRLIQSGLSVTVIDRGAISGGTTSAGEGNILVSDKDPGPELSLALRSREAWFELADEVGGEFELEKKGGLIVAKSEQGISDLKVQSARQSQSGVIVHQLDHAELHEIEPHLSNEIPYGVYYPQDSQLNPMLGVAQILKKFRELGGKVVTEAKVLSISTDAMSVTGVVTSKGEFSSRNIVNATGTWAGEIAEMAGSHLPIAPRRGFILVTAPTPSVVRHKVYDADYVANVASGSADLQTSAVIEGTRSGTILIGSSRERVGYSTTFDVRILRKLSEQALALFPALRKVQIMRAYFGFRPYAPDHLPVIGEDARVKGLWHATGHEGAGIGLAPATAEIIAAQITGKDCLMDVSPFSPARFAHDL
ncbi:MAG: FAD-binding oxidoreductase [Actinobacteria bacterium]|nr:FAD-binding oxidoreductase [Actinomycetota bacterium]